MWLSQFISPELDLSFLSHLGSSFVLLDCFIPSVSCFFVWFLFSLVRLSPMIALIVLFSASWACYLLSLFTFYCILFILFPLFILSYAFIFWVAGSGASNHHPRRCSPVFPILDLSYGHVAMLPMYILCFVRLVFVVDCSILYFFFKPFLFCLEQAWMNILIFLVYLLAFFQISNLRLW